MKKATATSHGKSRLLDAGGETGDGGALAELSGNISFAHDNTLLSLPCG
jgi:hypothetical protein